jgi:uncharacterized protein
VLTPLEWTIAVVITFVASVVQGTIGFGLGVMSAPLLTLVNPLLTPVPQLMLSVPLAIGTAWREWANVDRAGLGWITLGRVPGAIAGAWIVTQVTERTLGIVIALVVLAAVAASNTGMMVPINTYSRFGAGLTAGFTGTTSGIGGPPIALLYRGADPETARSSVGAALALGLVVNLTTLGAAGAIAVSDYVVTAWLMVPTMLGFAASGPLRSVVRGAGFKTAVLTISALGAVFLLIRSLAG